MSALIFRVAWRNIWRNTRRTVITLITMVICVGVMVWMITFGDGVHEQMIRSSLNLGLGSLQIHALGYQEDRAPDKAILDPAPLVAIARAAPGLEGVSTRINGFGLVSHSGVTQPAAILGVEPVGETTISIIFEKMVKGAWLPETIENERRLPIVIGAEMARKLEVDIGDRLYISMGDFTGAPAYAVYFVHGIFRSGMGEMDKSLAYVPIDTLRPLMAADIERFRNAVHEVTVLLEPKADVNEAVAFVKDRIPPDQLEQPDAENVSGSAQVVPEQPPAGGSVQKLEVLSWEEIQPGLRTFIDLDNWSIYVFMLFMFIVVAIGIMNIFLMAVFERIREFGILMSLGTRPSAIFWLVMTESFLVGLLGAIAGLGAGLIGYWINSIYPFSYASYGEELSDIMQFDWSMKLYPTLIWVNVMKAEVSIVAVTMLAALWPAIKASMLKPIEALRHV